MSQKANHSLKQVKQLPWKSYINNKKKKTSVMVLSRLGNLTLKLPDTESLQQAGIQEFSEDIASKGPPTMLNPTVQKLTKTIKALETQQSNHSNMASNMVTLGRGLQSLPKKMVDQIRSNQYVDFTELPPAKGLAKTIPQTVVGDGQLILVQTTDLTDSRRIIPSLAVWLQCFSLYIAALSPPQDRLCDLMAYQAFIARCSVKYNWPSWVVYDQNFCMEAANQPDRLWAQIFTPKLSQTSWPLQKTGVQSAKVWIMPGHYAQGSLLTSPGLQALIGEGTIRVGGCAPFTTITPRVIVSMGEIAISVMSVVLVVVGTLK